MREFVDPLKYLTVFTLPVLAFFSFMNTGWLTFLPMLEAFILIPIIELMFKPDHRNLSISEEQDKLKNPLYDLVTYLTIPVQFVLLGLFLHSMGQEGLSWLDKIGRISGMGLLCGVMGINVAHELGHRSKKHEKFLSKLLLLSSLYMHFYIEHNRGHHTRVSTPNDPASARFGESLYRFWFRSVIYSYFSAWRIEKNRLEKAGSKVLSMNNEMILFQIIQVLFVAMIFLTYGIEIGLYFIGSALFGILLLETVNYIEHYGLSRNRKEDSYERVKPWHSWNSDHLLGRLMLFELSRHSDHHYKASRKYQVLRYYDSSPQMPTGYPGMMILAICPPLWFRIMNPRVKSVSANV